MKFLLHLIFALVATLVFLLAGCASGGKTETGASRTPDLILSIGYLDLSGHRGRIERKDVLSLAGVLKKEKIDVLGVTGIARYPGVATRIDFVNVLSSLAEMRAVFGIASDNSGRQRGHAVFSVYPFHSTATVPYEDLSDESSSAVLAVVDGGVSDLQVINTLLPAASAERHLRVAIAKSDEAQPLILLGNLPKILPDGFTVPTGSGTASPVCLRDGEQAEPVGTRTVSSVYGKIVVAQVGLFRR